MDSHTVLTTAFSYKKLCINIFSDRHKHPDRSRSVSEECGYLLAALQCSVLSPAGTEVAIKALKLGLRAPRACRRAWGCNKNALSSRETPVSHQITSLPAHLPNSLSASHHTLTFCWKSLIHSCSYLPMYSRSWLSRWPFNNEHKHVTVSTAVF